MNRREKLFEAGVQFGHKTQYWHPKMAPFIWGKKEGIHLINVALTDIQLQKAEALLEQIAAQGLPILWVGTKKIARNIVSKFAQECSSPYFANRWVGGTLTNYHEVKKAVKKMLVNEEIYQKSESQDIYTKKELSLLQKKVERSKRVISGIEKLSYPVGALIVTDVQKDKVAVKEAIRIGVPVIGLVDTNANPEGITVVIPTNDDLEDALAIISGYLAAAINKGRETFVLNNQVAAEKQTMEKNLEERKYSKPNQDNTKKKTKATEQKVEVASMQRNTHSATEETIEENVIEVKKKATKTPKNAKKELEEKNKDNLQTSAKEATPKIAKKENSFKNEKNKKSPSMKSKE